MIQFKKDGDWIQEIDENRFYFLAEAEEIIQSIIIRLTKEKRVIKPKAFCLVIDGQEILHSFVNFNSLKNGTLQEQIVQTILHYESWEEELRQTYVNKVNAYVEQERQVFIHQEFRMFAIRLEEVLSADFSLLQMKYLFDQVYTSLTTGFFSKMEEVISSLSESYQTVLSSTAKGDCTWFEDEKQFQSFGQYVLANYLSVSKTRLPAIQIQLEAYHKLQDYLFTVKVEQQDFYRVLTIHEEIQQEFLRRWNQILFQGFALKTDDMVKSLLLVPCIQAFFRKEYDQKKKLSSKELAFVEEILHLEHKEEENNDETTALS